MSVSSDKRTERLARINPLNTLEEIDKYLDRNLPKWPQMIVTGRPVKEVQARGIIRRTDTFFTHGYTGNDHEWDDEVKKAVGLPIGRPSLDVYDQEDAWKRKWECVSTQYVHNSWISCPFIFGPHGWCHPDGQIGFEDNVGKWPSVIDILEDWSELAREFPFLDLGVTLMNLESGENDKRPVVDMRVRDGRVSLLEIGSDVHGSRVPAPTERKSLGLMLHGRHRQRESAIPEAWLPVWAAIAREKGLV